MIKLLKVGDVIYSDVEPVVMQPSKFDESGMPVEFTQVKNPILPDTVEELRELFKDTLDWYTSRYVQKEIQSVNEDLSDITSELKALEAQLAAIAIANKINVTMPEIYGYTAMYIEGKITDDDVFKLLDEKIKAAGITDAAKAEQIKSKILPLLTRGMYIAKIIMWKEQIWAIEEKLEQQIDQMDEEKLYELDIEKLAKESYPTLKQFLQAK